MSDAAPDVARNLASNLLSLRKTKGLSQEQLARLAEIPRSTLTHIESGSGNPSLHNLARLSGALQVGIEELLSRPRNEIELIPAARIPVQRRSQGRALVSKLLPDLVQGLEVDRLEIVRGATLGGHPHLAGAKEYLYVLEGEITMAIAGEQHRVQAGSLLAFPGDQPHSYRNTGAVKASAISVIIPVALR